MIRRQSGYVLLGITIAIVIMGIFMGLAGPVWQTVMKREREEELLWRGRQYVRAIELYQKKYPGAYPANLEILVKEKFLRKLYPDPMAEDGEWKILRQLSPEVRRMQNPAGRAGGLRDGDKGNRQARGKSASKRQPRRSSFGARGDERLGGIVGVVSKSEEESLRIIDGKSAYNEWLFVYVQDARGTRRPGAPGRRPPGAPRPRNRSQQQRGKRLQQRQ
jgi:type II secretory pathway pseudopilin PulG